MEPVRELTVNGVRHSLEVDPGRTLLSVLRDTLGLTGAKYGCGEGQCAACTVLVDGEPVRSCLTRVGAVGEKRVATVEGLAPPGKLHPVQEAFLEEGAFQCGYCTPGMVLGAVAFLARSPDPSEEDVSRGLEGHICRCGVHRRIIAAVRRAAKTLREEGKR
jgi:nicotinate dehydrogenase subunit A